MPSQGRSSEYKPLEMTGGNIYDPSSSDESRTPRTATELCKFAGAVALGLVIGLIIGPALLGIGAEHRNENSVPPSPSQRCGGPVEGPSRHLRPWDTLSPALSSCGGDRGVGLPFAGRSAVLGRRGMAATSQPLVSMVAIDVMKRGGSAVDAAVAANLVQGLVEPMSNGIGGDLFAILYDPKTKKLVRGLHRVA
eukprot:SAG11_NODE_13_length_26388_cov_67.360341_28_plen_194_part_00